MCSDIGDVVTIIGQIGYGSTITIVNVVFCNEIKFHFLFSSVNKHQPIMQQERVMLML